MRYTHGEMVDPVENPLTPYQRLQLGLNQRIVVGFTIGLFLFMVIPAGMLIWFASKPQQPPITRVIFLLLSAVCLMLPVRIAAISVRRKLATGNWSPTLEERLELRSHAGQQGGVPWISPILIVMYLAVAAVALVVALRGPFDAWNYGFVVVWVLLALQSIWQMVRESRKANSTK